MTSQKISLLPILMITLVFGIGCSDSSTSSETAVTSSVNTCSAPVTEPIWKGERSIATTASLRGAWSDVKIPPNSTYPASAYTDAGCACIRYTYWDGTDWTTEIIAAANTTTFSHVRMAFLSTGVPVVVWTNSTTTLQLAIRSAANTTAAGTWALTTLDTLGTTIRAIEIKINPADQVAILYARATVSTAHLILCTSGCSVGSSYSSPSTTLGTVGTTPHTLGLGWCKATSSYYPVVALNGAANSSYGICRQSNLSTCLNGIASWAGGALQTLTGSGASRPTVQLAMDDTTVDAPVRALLTNGTNLIHYQSAFAGGGCALGTVGAIATTGAIAGTGATNGNAYLELQRVTGSNYHLIANEGTTIVKYYNTTGSNFASWNPAGTVSTSTLAAAGSIRGGLAVDVSLSQAYTTFSKTAATGPFNGNLSFGWIENTTMAANNATAEYYETPLTVDGQLQLLASQVPALSVDATSSGTPAAAFVDYSSNSTTVGLLKYAIRNGSTSASRWIVQNVPISAQPQNVALKFDANNKPWIAFYDQLSFRFLLVTNTETDGTGVWSTFYFPFLSAVTAATAPAYHSVALAMDRSATAVTPIMIIGIANHGTLANTGIWAARLNSATGDWTYRSQVKSIAVANSVSNLVADSDTLGNVVVAYFNRGTANRLEYFHSTNGGVAWSTPTNITAVTGAGMGARIRLNPANSKPATTYFDRANNRIYYSYCTSALANCSSLANWSSSNVESASAGVSGLASTSDGLLSTGLSFTSTGEAYVVYPSGPAAEGSLKLNSDSSGAFATSSTQLVAGRNANTTANPTMSAINFAQQGWNVDSIRTSTQAMHSLFIGAGNWLYATSCGD